MPNVTIVIDEDLLTQARLRAVERGTSLNAVIRGLLANYVHGSPVDQIEAIEDFIKLGRKSGARRGKNAWAREDLYER